MTPPWWNEREDGRRGVTPDVVERAPGTAAECVRWACRVRLPWHMQPRVQLVIRAYTATAEVTVALEALRTE